MVNYNKYQCTLDAVNVLGVQTVGVHASTEFVAVSFDFSVAITTYYAFMKFYLLLIDIIIFEIGNFLKILILIDSFFSFFLGIFCRWQAGTFLCIGPYGKVRKANQVN